MQEVESPSLSSVTSVRSRLAETASCTTGTPDSEFEADISHWENSSSQVSACSVELEPSTPHDVGLILTQPVLSGRGTPQLYEFADPDIVINMDSETVEIGAGLSWTEIYTYLQVVPRGVNAVGGRLHGVGVAGVLLGGGYSWKTNQYWLAVDNVQVVAYELVLPNGRVKAVTERDEDIWFALKYYQKMMDFLRSERHEDIIRKSGVR
ncbi:hypothetical protein V8E53_002879 [Lactarius tabidus]